MSTRFRIPRSDIVTPRLPDAAKALATTSAVTAAAFGLLLAVPGTPVGWPNRLLIVGFAVWMLVAALLVRTVGERASAQRSGEQRAEPERPVAELAE